MNPFQSRNIWKRAAREKKRAEQPKTPEQVWRGQVTSNSLWLLGGSLLTVLYLAGLRAGALALTVETGVILAVVVLYTAYCAVTLGKLWRNKPGKS